MSSRAEHREAGFTLVEVSILLTVVAILAAAVAPVLSSTIADSKMVAARVELQSIAQGLQSFLEDLGCAVVPRNDGSDPVSSGVVTAPSASAPNMPPLGGQGAGFIVGASFSGSCDADLCDSAPVELLVSSGDIPALGPEGDEEWTRPVDYGAVDFLEYYLVSNTPGDDAGRAFPGLDDCVDGAGGDALAGIRAWRGAYLNVGAGDPWGNRYMINSEFLIEGSAEDVVLLSAGPDQEIDSVWARDGFVAGDDDVALIFSPGR